MPLRFPQLQRVETYPFDVIIPALSFNGPFYDSTIVKTAADSWTETTALQYDPIESLRVDLTRPVICPKCDAIVAVPWHTDDNHGFADELFSHPCQCGLVLDSNALCIAKFLNALSDYDAKGTPLPNIIEMTYGKFDETTARELSKSITDIFFEHHNNRLPTVQQVLARASARRQTGYEYIAALLTSARLPPMPNIATILLPFRHSYPFTQDIVRPMVHIQRPLSSLNAEGLLPTSLGANIDLNFTQSYREYVEYLNTLADSPGTHDGPPLLVDLVWHTHILKAETYRDDCLQLIGCIPNHVLRDELMSPALYTHPDEHISTALEEQSKLFLKLAAEYAQINPQTAQCYTELSKQIWRANKTWEKLKEHRPEINWPFIRKHPNVLSLQLQIAGKLRPLQLNSPD